VQGEFNLILVTSKVVPFNSGIHFFVTSADRSLDAEKRRAAVEGFEFVVSGPGSLCKHGEFP